MVLSGFTALTNANVLIGSIFEFMKRPSRINVGLVTDVAINAGNTYTLTIGDQVVASAAVIFPGIVNTATSFIVGVVWPDHFMVQNEPALAGDRIVLSIARAAGNIMWCVQVTEVA